MKKSYVFIASVKQWNGSAENPAKADKNGLMPVVLVPISGHSPRGLNIISGTSAQLQGFTVGSVHAVTATEGEPYDGDNGLVRTFNFSSVGTVSAIEAVEYAQRNPLTVAIQPEGVGAPEQQPAIGAEA